MHAHVLETEVFIVSMKKLYGGFDLWCFLEVSCWMTFLELFRCTRFISMSSSSGYWHIVHSCAYMCSFNSSLKCVSCVTVVYTSLQLCIDMYNMRMITHFRVKRIY